MSVNMPLDAIIAEQFRSTGNSAGPATPETEARRLADEALDRRIRKIVREEIEVSRTSQTPAERRSEWESAKAAHRRFVEGVDVSG